MIPGNDETRWCSLKKRLFQISEGVAAPARGFSGDYCRLGRSPSGPCTTNPMSKLLSWCRRLSGERARFLHPCSPVGAGNVPVGEDPMEDGPAEATVTVPKGQLAVYVGRRSGEFRRVLVPVVDFNHPLFRDLLTDAEEEFGFSHRGGVITIPCEVSEFERVKNRVAATGYSGRRSTWKKHR